jgi:hypothetical protein
MAEFVNVVCKSGSKSQQYDKFPLYIRSTATRLMKNPSTAPQSDPMLGAEISDYVAHLQLHMALQSRNLMPNVMEADGSLHALLRDSQAHCEKLSSRQGF